ncbi:hypothetical protein BDF20DRAFT_118227 [Mycotypha africana]|uniref:uncharacterized protein n=1 Tax=Mycotypha africana TaxID=64632 RepID=UPI00230190B2|nr:uncharacterized protein BDF20DRAFT_118227 [Mycotypha africana]KAI8970322.1 hypothetical protein BDF20DRAFT_118227 [Mycotypha africana]
MNLDNIIDCICMPAMKKNRSFTFFYFFFSFLLDNGLKHPMGHSVDGDIKYLLLKANEKGNNVDQNPFLRQRINGWRKREDNVFLLLVWLDFYFFLFFFFAGLNTKNETDRAKQ